MAINLLSNPTRVSTPFVIATIAGYTFGAYSKEDKTHLNASYYTHRPIVFPNFMQSLTVDKISGTVNTYTLQMSYQIKQGDDPDLLEKVFSKAKQDRKIILTYGDWSIPTFIYKEEQAIITKVNRNIDISNSNIQYTITAVSSSKLASSGQFNFEKKYAKPSDEIKRILYDERYGLLEIFTGMKDKELVLSSGLIVSNDKEVFIEAKQSISVIDYLQYLVNCMTNNADDLETFNSSRYLISVDDSVSNRFEGCYFRVAEMTTRNINENSLSTYEINVGFPGENQVLAFNVEDDDTYSILYDYTQDINQTNYVYRIDDEGNIQSQFSPSLTNSSSLKKTTAADRSWWTQVTKYPINATIRLRGLIKPAILMSYVKLNVVFFGRKSSLSGYYTITKQTDTIASDGYYTTLKVTRIKGDDEYGN